MTLVAVARVEVSLLESSIDRVEDKSVEAVLVEVLLNGEDLGFGSGVPDRPIFIADQPLGLCGVFRTLGHCFRILLQYLGPDFGREELCHEGHANLVDDVLMNGLFSGVALLGGVVARRRSIRQG